MAPPKEFASFAVAPFCDDTLQLMNVLFVNMQLVLLIHGRDTVALPGGECKYAPTIIVTPPP